MKRFFSVALIFVICLALCACTEGNNTDYTSAQNNTTTTTASTTTTQRSTTMTTNSPRHLAVADAVNYTMGEEVLFNVKLPKIVGNTDTIEKINRQMLHDALPVASRFYAEHFATRYSSLSSGYGDGIVFDKGATFDYCYTVKNDILVVYVYSTIPQGSTLWGQSGDGMYRKSYYYDVANDKILTISQTAEKLALEMPDDYDTDSFPLDSGCWLITFDDNELKLELFM